MIEARELTKDYGSKRAVDGLTFTVQPGIVTGFLGPNGSGKSTTMRLILGLDRPDAGRVRIGGDRHHEPHLPPSQGGRVRIGGHRYRDLRWPLRQVGALLEAKAFHPGRTARAHLAALAASNAIATGRVDEVLGMVGLAGAARK